MAERRSNFVTNIIEEDLKSGKHSSTHTRFPPEPNGYLHLGHAKSMCLNFGIAQTYGGKCNLRFDDTNPQKEEQEYIDGIMEDITWLGFRWDGPVLHASDYFQQLYDGAVKLIHDGNAYIDQQTAEEVQTNRGDINHPGRNSPWRERPVEESLKLLEEMRLGLHSAGDMILRAKIDMAHVNPLMRDPPMYRISNDEHPRTGKDWCIYPLYDYAHGQSDSYEGITHSICTLEFEVHRVLYEWYQEKLGILKTRQIEFARLNLTKTVMSKRKLQQLVELGYVSGWDDPRMPTLCGMRRRGYTPTGIKDFCNRVGVAKRENTQTLELLELCVRESISDVPRCHIVLNPVKVTITNLADGETHLCKAKMNPTCADSDMRTLTFSNNLYVDASDFLESGGKQWKRLSIGQEVRLRWGPWITATQVIKGVSGEVVEILATYEPESLQGGSPTCGRKPQGTIHWLSIDDALPVSYNLYSSLFKMDDPEDPVHLEGAAEGVTWTSLINPKSLISGKGYVEKSAARLTAGSAVQGERVGYFTADIESTEEHPIWNRIVRIEDNFTANSDKDAKKEAEKMARAAAAEERKRIKEARAARKKKKTADTQEI